jgi:hypothetical protein
MFPDATFDLVHSCIVLQHIEPLYTKEYLREFLRVTRPGGTVVFQLPSHPRPAAPATPLPDGAFKARIELAEPAPPRLSTDEVLTLSVRVTNLGDAVWPAHTEGDVGYHLRLGNHWLTSGGKIAVVDDGRSQLPVDLEPGSSGVMSLRVRAPARPGFYVLELDLVQEAVTWFSRRGSETLQVPVMVEGSRRRAPVAGALVSRLRHSSIMPTVVRIMPKVMRKAIRVARTWGPTDPPPDAAPDPGAGHDPGFEMHSVPHDEVVEVLQAAGGRIVAYHEDPYAGPEWVSYLYFVAREAVRQPDH